MVWVFVQVCCEREVGLLVELNVSSAHLHCKLKHSGCCACAVSVEVEEGRWRGCVGMWGTAGLVWVLLVCFTTTSSSLLHQHQQHPPSTVTIKPHSLSLTHSLSLLLHTDFNPPAHKNDDEPRCPRCSPRRPARALALGCHRRPAARRHKDLRGDCQAPGQGQGSLGPALRRRQDQA